MACSVRPAAVTAATRVENWGAAAAVAFVVSTGDKTGADHNKERGERELHFLG